MLFQRFIETATVYPDKLALNSFTYRDLVTMIAERPYNEICEQTDWTILLDILKAASLDKPIRILPKYKRENLLLDSKNYIGFGIALFSSGSSGPRKEIFLSDAMLVSNAFAAIISQGITKEDKILTVCSLNHTGGINAQTLAGLIVGAHVIVEPFNIFNFYRLIKENNITLTHLVPNMIDMLENCKSILGDSKLRLVVAGSDCVYKHHVKHWLDLGIEFMINYGMTEAGPIIINHRFKKDSELSIYDIGIPLGTESWCDTRIVDGQLFLKGANVYKSNWLATGDCVELNGDWYLYKGRKSAGCKIIPKAY